ncbi:MAG: c-type cytochrome [Betaproteobacteria bacterium AqS2]|uniref:C-type cytochrome n=1 Tax=Candidatus Amphirhobacter heronislandensis TaxID=1732024 RepID=A0A930Y3G4_9GAMM|nr:c-type cytochrome [Betaproteobacteria bacterium AqS2]
MRFVPPRSARLGRALLAALLAAAAAGFARGEGDPARGEVKAHMCMGCHNIEGYRITFPEAYLVPRIQGQTAEYIEYALREYASGNRYHGGMNKMASMPAIAASLTDEDIADLAAYYSGLGQ